MKVDAGLKHDLRLGLCCLPALMLIFISGFLLNHVAEASVIASGALPLAFGASKTWEGSSFKLLLATVVGLGFSSWLGAMAGSVLPLYISLAMIYTAAYAIITGIDGTAGWVFLQAAIAFLVSGYFPGDMAHATHRALLISIGGLVQLTIICLLLSKGHFHLQWVSRFSLFSFLRQETLKHRHKLHLRWSVLFGLLSMGMALFTVELYHLKNGYWTGMTLLLCLRNHYQESLLRVPARLFGTFLGCLSAGVLTYFFPQLAVLACGFIVSGYIAFTLSYRLATGSYFVFTFFVTLMVVFMISLTGLAQGNVAADRLTATAIGGAYALAAILFTRLATALQIRLSGNNKPDSESLF
jgi:hypothetical protein